MKFAAYQHTENYISIENSMKVNLGGFSDQFSWYFETVTVSRSGHLSTLISSGESVMRITLHFKCSRELAVKITLQFICSRELAVKITLQFISSGELAVKITLPNYGIKELVVKGAR